MKQKPLRHRIEKTKNKHSRAILRDGEIIIRLAGGLSNEEEKEHIQDLLERMREQAKDELNKKRIDPFSKLLDSGESSTVTLSNGRKYRFTLKPGKKTSVRRTTRGWTISVGPKLRRKGLHRLLWRALSQAELPYMERLVDNLNDETFGVGISNVKLQFASSQWGSCSPRGVIMINTALLFTEPKVLEYVILHELAHRKRADHSPQYWQWVEWAMPHYKKWRSKLQDYRLPSA